MNQKNIITKLVLIIFTVFLAGFYGFTKRSDYRSQLNTQASEASKFEETAWEKTYGGQEREIGWSVQAAGDGGFIIAGLTSSFGAGETDAYLLKTDPEGNLEWQRTFGSEWRDMSLNVQLTSDEGYILCGTAGSGSCDSDIHIVKTDSAGQLEWEKMYGGKEADRGGCIKQTKDRGYIICGETSSFGAGESDIYLIKINSNGKKEWQKTYGGPGRDWCHNVQLTADGGYILGGNTASYGQGKMDVYLIKTDNSGNKEWTQTYGGPQDEFIFGTHGLIQTKDKGFIFCTYGESYGKGMTDFYIVKTDSSGNTEWEKTYGGSQDDGALSILQTQDLGYYVCGFTKSLGVGNRDVYLVKIDKNGIKERERTFGGPDFDCGIALMQTADGGLIICGETASYGAGERDVYLIKTAPIKNN